MTYLKLTAILAICVLLAGGASSSLNYVYADNSTKHSVKIISEKTTSMKNAKKRFLNATQKTRDLRHEEHPTFSYSNATSTCENHQNTLSLQKYMHSMYLHNVTHDYDKFIRTTSK